MDEIICASHNQTHTHHAHTVDLSWLISVEFKNSSCFDLGVVGIWSSGCCPYILYTQGRHPMLSSINDTRHTHTYWHATLSIRLLWIKLNCNYDKLSSIMPCHPFCPTKSDVICFKLGNGYPFNFILSLSRSFSRFLSLSLWFFCYVPSSFYMAVDAKACPQRTHITESHQLVSMNTAIWTTGSSLQRNYNFVFFSCA